MTRNIQEIIREVFEQFELIDILENTKNYIQERLSDPNLSSSLRRQMTSYLTSLVLCIDDAHTCVTEDTTDYSDWM